MKHTPRLYSCALCHKQTVICTNCDRGHIYCSQICARTARVKSCREAESRYQQTQKGRLHHAARQQRYRIRLGKKVTDHGSNSTSLYGLLQKAKNKTEKPINNSGFYQKQCSICKNDVLPYVRTHFLSHCQTKSSYFRPP